MNYRKYKIRTCRWLNGCNLCLAKNTMMAVCGEVISRAVSEREEELAKLIKNTVYQHIDDKLEKKLAFRHLRYIVNTLLQKDTSNKE